MKALTVRNPWAWAIAHGVKTIENRTWNTTYRGRLAIHAAARPDREDAFARVYELTGAYVLKSPASAIVAVVDLVDVCTAQDCECGPWAVPGQLHWQFANARELPDPVPCKGRLGLWDLNSEAEAAVHAQLGARVAPGC
ncbi:ASCH domain-containing protein [Sphaerimonospora mesophila]|uniref:ASCH domain-containing protein n=1 Tax=Sphaerimonospora mesophila TaxID=37483 RepID=UPI0007C7384C